MFSTNDMFCKYFWLRLVKYKGDKYMTAENCVVIDSNKCLKSSFLIVPCLVSLAMSLCRFLRYLPTKCPPIQFILVT